MYTHVHTYVCIYMYKYYVHCAVLCISNVRMNGLTFEINSFHSSNVAQPLSNVVQTEEHKCIPMEKFMNAQWNTIMFVRRVKFVSLVSENVPVVDAQEFAS